nr:hypothetical protein [Streptomyces sp. TLI_235]
MRAKRARSFTVAALAAAGLLAAGGQPAAAAGPYPVEYHFGAGFVKGFFSPDRPPAGANDPSCRPSAAHPARSSWCTAPSRT